jgi:hypothetical protein
MKMIMVILDVTACSVAATLICVTTQKAVSPLYSPVQPVSKFKYLNPSFDWFLAEVRTYSDPFQWHYIKFQVNSSNTNKEQAALYLSRK